VHAALAAVTAFVVVGHRSVYASQKLGIAKSAGLDITLGGAIGDLDRAGVRIRKGSLTDRIHNLLGRRAKDPAARTQEGAATEHRDDER
jgi:hypothetical protein